ncbi:unnamed protein product [Echinostoma caproni]|uniref:Nipped-B protein n=1 Tax=Echinostoma caproni TaxID=27848 RepID=A0A183A122_9TREM|nr:unnamed protein product [Echinostoma caproni]
MSQNAVVSTHISKLAQDSLREVKRLRIILTRLLANVTNTGEEESDGTDNLPECETGVKQLPKTGAATTSNLGMTDSKTTIDALDSPRGPSQTGKKSTLSENLQPHRLIAQIRDCFEVLDELARHMRNSRVRSCMGDLGLHNALSLITTVDQLEFPTDVLGDESDAFAVRRADWLVDRWDAERWKNRYCERAHTILEGLLACSMFQRSHLNSEQKRRMRDSVLNSPRDVRCDLECLLNEIHAFFPKLIITLVESGSSISVVHVKVGYIISVISYVFCPLNVYQ